MCAKLVRRGSIVDRRATNPAEAVRNLLATVSHYEKKVQESGADLSSASSVIKLISKEIERDGLMGAKEMNEDDPPCVLQPTLSVNINYEDLFFAENIRMSWEKQDLYDMLMQTVWLSCLAPTLSGGVTE